MQGDAGESLAGALEHRRVEVGADDLDVSTEVLEVGASPAGHVEPRRGVRAAGSHEVDPAADSAASSLPSAA